MSSLAESRLARALAWLAFLAFGTHALFHCHFHCDHVDSRVCVSLPGCEHSCDACPLCDDSAPDEDEQECSLVYEALGESSIAFFAPIESSFWTSPFLDSDRSSSESRSVFLFSSEPIYLKIETLLI